MHTETKMDHQTQAEAVQDVVANVLAEMGVQDPASVVHTFLIRGGYFVGHKFRCEGVWAIWPIGAESVEFHAADGTLIKTVSLDTVQKKTCEPPAQKSA